MNPRATRSRIRKTASAMAPTAKGRPVSTGGISISSRMEFCHSEECHRKYQAMPAQTTAAAPLR